MSDFLLKRQSGWKLADRVNDWPTDRQHSAVKHACLWTVQVVIAFAEMRKRSMDHIPVFSLSFSSYEESSIHNIRWTHLTLWMKYLRRKIMHCSYRQVFFAFLGFSVQKWLCQWNLSAKIKELWTFPFPLIWPLPFKISWRRSRKKQFIEWRFLLIENK